MIKIKLKRKLWFYPHRCPDWAWDSTIPLSEIIIATEPGSTRPGSRGFASWCSLNKGQADKFGINYGMGNPNGAKGLLKKVEDK